MASTLERLAETQGLEQGSSTPGGTPEAATHGGPLARLGRWTATHFGVVLLVWLVIIGTFGVFAVQRPKRASGPP